MKLRIYAVVFSLLAGGLGIALWKERVNSALLTAQVTRLSRVNAELNYEVKQSAKNAAKFEQRAAVLDSQLGSAKSRTTATESKQVQLTRELHETKTQLTEREQREVALMAELATLRQKVAAAQLAPTDDSAVLLPMMVVAQPTAKKSAVGPGPTGESKTPAPATATAPPREVTSAADLAAYDRRIAELEQQLTQLLTRALTDPVETPAASVAPAMVVAVAPPPQVVRVGPRDSFVVIDYGAEHGAQVGDIATLRRGTTEVARVQISDARPKFALAQVLPASLKGQLQTGDLVIFTR